MLAKTKFSKLGRLIGPAVVIMMMIGLFPALGFSATYTIYPTDDAAVDPNGSDNSYML